MAESTKQEHNYCPICGNDAALFETLHDDRHGFPGRFPYYKCSSCGLAFHTEGMDAAQMRHLYSEYYPRASFSEDGWHAHDWSPSLRSWLKGDASAYMHVPPNVRVLDIGCGAGESLGYHRNRGCSAHGTEMDENAGRIARKWNLDIKLGPFDSAQWEEAFFDYVTLDQVLEHNAEPLTLLQDIRTVLKPKGSLLVTTPNVGSFTAACCGRNWIHWHPPYHTMLYTKKALKAVLKRAGFRVRWMRTITPSTWLQYQYLHRYFAATEGERSRFWDPRAPQKYSDTERKILRTSDRLLRYHAFSGVARLLDVFGVGDSLMVCAVPETSTFFQTGTCS